MAVYIVDKNNKHILKISLIKRNEHHINNI